MERDFFEAAAKAGVKQAIGAVEAQSSAELVVAVRRASGDYRVADYRVAAAAAFAALVLLLFLPRPFRVTTMPLDVAAVFGLALLASARSPALRRLFTAKMLRRSNVATAARAAFVELGVSRTRGRSGVLVFVSLLERTVEVVTDVGIDPAALGASWSTAVAALQASVSHVPDVTRFLAALNTLGPPLSAALPHQADDINELPDDLSVN